MIAVKQEGDEAFVLSRSSRSYADARLLGAMRLSSAQLYKRSIKRYLDAVELHLGQTGLQLGEAQRGQIAKTAADFLRHLRLAFRFPRLSIKIAVVVVAHQLLRTELASELLEAEDLLAGISDDHCAKRRGLGVYLAIYRRSFGRMNAARFLECVRRQAAEFVTRHDGDGGSLATLDALLGLLTGFSEYLRLSLRNKRLRNLALALALLTLQATKGVALQPAQFISGLKRQPWRGAAAADSLLDRISPSSVTRLIFEFSSQFNAFIRDKIAGDEEIFRQLCRKSRLLTAAVVRALGLEQNHAALRDNFWLLLRTATASKDFLAAYRGVDSAFES